MLVLLAVSLALFFDIPTRLSNYLRDDGDMTAATAQAPASVQAGESGTGSSKHASPQSGEAIGRDRSAAQAEPNIRAPNERPTEPVPPPPRVPAEDSPISDASPAKPAATVVRRQPDPSVEAENDDHGEAVAQPRNDLPSPVAAADSDAGEPQVAGAVSLPGTRIPRLLELPLATRQSLPELTLNVHVYDSEPRDRFVLINMVRYQEGDTVGGEVYVERIDGDGVELQFRTTRFRLTAK